MRKLLLLTCSMVALIGVAPAAAATVTITITRAGFAPNNVTVAQGDTVTWTNSDTAAHQVVFRNFNCSLTIQAGQQGSCTFTSPGKFNYSDPSQRGGKWSGTVTVKPGPTSVTLQASKTTVVFGNSATLSGKVSTGRAGESIQILAQACGQAAFAHAATVTTTTGGAFSYVTTPGANTTYQAKWKNTSSAAVVVKVRPRVRLVRLAARRFSVRVAAATAFTGRYVIFQRYSASLGRFVNVKRVVLRRVSGAAPNVVTFANFRARLNRGIRIRALMPQSQVGGCYVAGIGNVIRS